MSRTSKIASSRQRLTPMTALLSFCARTLKQPVLRQRLRKSASSCYSLRCAHFMLLAGHTPCLLWQPADICVCKQCHATVYLAWNDVATHHMRRWQVTDLQRQRNELSGRIAELQAEHSAALQPMVTALRGEIATLAAEAAEERARAEKESKAIEDGRQRLAAIQVRACLTSRQHCATECQALFRAACISAGVSRLRHSGLRYMPEPCRQASG